MSLQVMVDIETLSVKPDAAILSIGACTFYLDKSDIEDTFYVNISPASNDQAGRDISADTISWWFQQEPAALAALGDNPTPLKLALASFGRWATNQPTKVTEVWANDPDFDIVILKQACEAVKTPWPFFFSLNRSVRTASAWAFPQPEDLAEAKASTLGQGTRHNALDDAVQQAKLIQLAYQRLVLKKAI